MGSEAQSFLCTESNWSIALIIKLKTSYRTELVDITEEVKKLIPSGMNSGICHVFSTHTTAGMTINENADPDVKSDIIHALEKLVPWKDSSYSHLEGNSAAHIKASMMGFAQTIPIVDGRLATGTWQGIYFCEFDGPRNRTVQVQFIKDI
jgi:secondary thiamine-phosphate synthase enzyme